VYTQIVTRIPGRHFLRNLVERRALVAQLVRRDFHTRYVGSAGGWAWGVIHPLVQLLVWYFIFVVCLKVPVPPGSVTDSYLIFLFSGFLPWMLFQETVTRSAGSLVDQSNLITRTVFPSEVVPVSIFLSSLIHHLIGLALFAVTALMVVRTLSPMALLLPLYMLFLGLFAIGVGWIVSSLHVYLRDTGQVLNVVLTLWFWLTPIMIPVEQIPPRFHFLVAWNPMSWMVNAYRYRLLAPTWPGGKELAVLSISSAAVFILGGLFFRHLKRGFADVL
jgi:lipopolysaccharide transport system permease protein